ncbi:SHOCT domain-containing protein [Leifsonia shinshuensis]|uniref:SHOCT domain-containing protein n=1 Tax=Leifsonia shinshuensis TaxID=150026 RepID=A0A7G6Y748_9MICO|nr:SHOCT domain-containing protein [Leifsonia shinshuensis]QNE34313.1 SHOCT domain-containing protein [Leifsonia shinshuensis]
MSLLRTAVRASVATRVIGNTHRRQQQRWAAQDAAATAQAPPPESAPSVLDQLAQLGQLREAGVLSEAEFETQKARILSA